MPSFLPISAEIFVDESAYIMRKAPAISAQTQKRRFRSLFGISPDVCAHIWKLLMPSLPSGSRPRHLLWALVFLKLYASEHVNSSLAGVNEKTFRKWSWCFIHCLSDLNLIRWKKWNEGRMGEVFKCSVDGTDFRICEPTPFSPKWYSHKFKGPGLRYEVGVAIGTGFIIWAHGPFPCGSFNVLKIYRLGMKRYLNDGEMVVVDGGYMDSTCSSTDSVAAATTWGYVRARHEVVNKHFKQFGVMGGRFRHHIELHSACFWAVVNLTQLMIESGEPVFNTDP